MNMCTALRIACFAGLLCATGTASAAAGDAADSACEAAVAETLRGLRGKAANEVKFGAARNVVPPPAGENPTLAGKGQYRGLSGSARPFNYTCTFDAQTGKASGVVLREAAAAAPGAGTEKPWEPDLTNLSPQACEAAAAAALKEQYPPIGRIRFASDSRRLLPAAGARTSLEGRGTLERAAGMNPAPFTYRCLLEASSGKVVSVQTQD